MSRESLIFLMVILAVWGLSIAARWLQKEIEKNTTDGIEFETIEKPPILESTHASKSEILATSEKTKLLASTALDQEKQTRKNKLSNQFGLDSTQTARQGIILMTILGPCRANEPISTIRFF